MRDGVEWLFLSVEVETTDGIEVNGIVFDGGVNTFAQQFSLVYVELWSVRFMVFMGGYYGNMLFAKEDSIVYR